MAAAGVRSSGAGLEMVPFSSPVVAVGRFEIWARNIDRQLMSAIAHDVELATTALRQYGQAGAPQRSTLLHAGTTGTIAGGNREASNVQPRPDAVPSSNQPIVADALAGVRSQPSLQARLLARSAHWTAAVDAALAGTTFWTSPSQPGGGSSSSRGGQTSDAKAPPENALQEILTSILLQVDRLAEELCQPGGMIAYDSVATTAITTQALHHRDVLEELLKMTPSSLSAIRGSAVQPETPTATSAAVTDVRSSLRIQSSPISSFPKEGDRESASFTEPAVFSPFLWTCHLRHYYTPPEEALSQEGAHPSGGNSGRDEDQEQEVLPPPPPPLIRVGIGPWNIPYGFEYAGTLERLWLTPLSERSLLHAVHSAKVWPLRLLAGVNGL